jgi:hypothetical protein
VASEADKIHENLRQEGLNSPVDELYLSTITIITKTRFIYTSINNRP